MIAARVLAMGVLAAAASLALACDPSPSASAAATNQRGGNCASCHLPEYSHAADPVHIDVKPTTCAVCHGQDGWRPSALHHEWWPLTGAHEKAPCSFCHNGTPAALAVLKGTPKECVSCHRPEYDASTFPGHSGFPTKCAECHATTGWRPATDAPPRTPDPVPPLGAVRPATSSPKLTPGLVPKPPAPTRPTANPTPPRVPTTRPPPDVTSRPSPRRR